MSLSALRRLVPLLGLLLVAPAARADFQVHSPVVEEGEIEFEHNGALTFDRSKSGLNNSQSYTGSVGYGVTDFWKAEIEGAWEGSAGSNLRFNALNFENTFQLAPQGRYWLTSGFFAAFGRSADRNSPDSFEFGPILQKEFSNSVHTLNLFFAKDVGRNAAPATQLSYAWQSLVPLNGLVDPGIELYGEIADLAHPGKLAEQQHRVGPVLVGAVALDRGKLKYEAGYLFGLTRATEQGALRWKLEYELAF
jgi:hypothetical protein